MRKLWKAITGFIAARLEPDVFSERFEELLGLQPRPAAFTFSADEFGPAQAEVVSERGAVSMRFAAWFAGGSLALLAVACMIPADDAPKGSSVDYSAAAGCATAIRLSDLQPNGTPLVDRLPECTSLDLATQTEALVLVKTRG